MNNTITTKEAVRPPIFILDDNKIKKIEKEQVELVEFYKNNNLFLRYFA